MGLKTQLRNAFRILGISISRYTPVSPVSEEENALKVRLAESEKFLWLKNYNIQHIFDIGANEGQFALKILTVFPEARIDCFEPLEGPRKILTLELNNHNNCTIHDFGLGDTDALIPINKNEYSPSSSLLTMLDLHKSNFNFAVKVEPELIKIRRLDDVTFPVIEKNLLIKIDVQGYELYVLRGGDKLISQAKVILIETSFHSLYEGQPLFEDIYEYLAQKGFRYAGNLEQLVGTVDHQILQADAIFINKNLP